MEVSDILESAHADGDEESVYEIHFCTLGMFIIGRLYSSWRPTVDTETCSVFP